MDNNLSKDLTVLILKKSSFDFAEYLLYFQNVRNHWVDTLELE